MQDAVRPDGLPRRTLARAVFNLPGRIRTNLPDTRHGSQSNMSASARSQTPALAVVAAAHGRYDETAGTGLTRPAR
jgi:hypothetical protein